MLRVLTVSSLYPNAVQQRHGVFVRERLRHLEQFCPLKATVIAPVPWFPFTSERFGRYGVFGRVPAREVDGGRDVLHPRFFVLPKVGGAFMPLSYGRAALGAVRELQGDFDLIDAHFAFPDGAAAVLVARKLGLPVVITVRGSDVNLMPREPVAGSWIRWALRRCDAVVAVSDALAGEVMKLAPSRDRVVSVSNGVDTERFGIRTQRDTLRRRLEFRGLTVLSVGNLIDLKGHDLVVDAIADLPDMRLVIVGDGPRRSELLSRVRELGIDDRVKIVGEIKQDELVDLYNAADFLVLASSHEGMPNVVLESLACGTPVLASAVGGVPEVLRTGVGGLFLDERSAEGVRMGLQKMAGQPWCRQQVRGSVESFSWQERAHRLFELFESVSRGPRNAPDGVQG